MAAYIEVSVRCQPSDEDIVTSYITESLSQGLVTEVNDDDFIVKFYLPAQDISRDKVESLGRYLVRCGLASPETLEQVVAVKAVDDIDWIESYQKSFQPVVVENVVVKSTWDTTHFPEKIEIIVEPKMAFGTGHHETTQLCMAQLLKDVKPGCTLLDLGTGSGILAILAAKLGAAECVGLDFDLAAIENAQENVRLNNVADVVSVVFGSMDKVSQVNYYDIVVSNLIKDEIFNLYENFVRCLKPGGVLILSGILREQESEFRRFMSLKKPRQCSFTHLKEWICCRVVKA